MIATKPLKSKNIYSKFSISRFIKEYDYPEFLIISEGKILKRFIKIKSKDSKHAKSKFRKRYPSEKILTVKNIKE